MIKRTAALALAVLTLTVVLAPAGTTSRAAPPNPYTVNEANLPFTPLPGATAYWGVHQGAGWRIEVPANWNGDLVLYAHGFVSGANLNLNVQNPSLRTHFINNGYAWAASSYRANGYVPGIGATDTYELLKLFANVAGKNHEGGETGDSGKPNRVYLFGVSMGGHVIGNAIEKWPNAFDGALPVCGVMGDNTLFDYFMDVYLVAETLVGNEPTIPSPANYATVGSVATRAQLGPNYPSVLNETGEIFKQVIKNRTGGERPTFNQGWTGPVGGNFIFSQAFAGPAQTNRDTVYQFDDDPTLSAEEQLFNETILRTHYEPTARNPWGIKTETTNSPAIRGNITIPVLTLHTLGELFVPFSMQQIYAQRVAEEGRSDLLVQRAIRATGHCSFVAAELTTGFNDLVAWVVDGVKPEGDDILDAANVAHPNFGCNFTTSTRPGIPACP